MATYKSEAGAILQPGNQINRLSSFNTEGVYGWPGIEAYELIGYAKVDNLAADKASYKSFDLIIPSPDRRPDDRVRDNRTSMVVQFTVLLLLSVRTFLLVASPHSLPLL